MQDRVLVSLILCFAVLVVDSAARADILQFTPDRDNTLYEDPVNDLSNGSGDQIFFGRTGPNADSLVRRALMRFDVSAIPADAVIDSVELSLEIDMVPFTDREGGTVFLHRVLSDWGEGASDAPDPEGAGTPAEAMDATWEHTFFDTDFWSQPGGDYLADPSAGVGYGTSTEVVTFTTTNALLRDIRKWVSQPGENFGWVVIGNEGVDHTARRVDSRENSDSAAPPLLTVESHIEGPTDDLQLDVVASGLSDTVGITNAGDGSQRLFVVQQPGVIRIVDLESGTLLTTPFLNITTRVDSQGDEQGLLGLAFHPDYENNRQFYVNYTYDPGPGLDRTRIAMYQASVGDPNVANTTETVLLEFEQDFANHNGGDLHFDPDGYLVIASGDGGSGGDPNRRAQDLDELLGKMLRIDVDTVNGVEKCGIVTDYGIPPDNPFTGAADGCDEILHYGVRNPWRFSYDARTGEMYIGDVGQGDWEEVSHAAPGETGVNFGWPCFEGTHNFYFPAEECPGSVDPIIEYSSGFGSGNCSVTGGYVYRGGIESLQGRYIYADYCSARIWIATRQGDEWISEEWIESPALGFIPTFGQDETCELYVANFSDSTVYRIVDTEEIDHSGFEALRCQ